MFHEDVQLLLTPEKKLAVNATRCDINEQSLFAPSTIWTDQEALEDPPFLERLPIPHDGIFPNGTVIRRLFKKDKNDKHTTWFEGLITSYDASSRYYKILYTDGDSDELDHSEIIKHWKQAYKHLDSLHALIRKKLAPTADDMNSAVPTLDIHSLRAIT